MPTFITVKEGNTIWCPPGSVLFMEDGPGRLTTNVTAILPTPKGPAACTMEVEGRCGTHGALLDKQFEAPAIPNAVAP